MSDRTFRLILDGKKGGLVKGSSPSSAAKKACKKLSAETGKTSFKFELQETTKDSKKKVYGPYKTSLVKDKIKVKMAGGMKDPNELANSSQQPHQISRPRQVIINDLLSQLESTIYWLTIGSSRLAPDLINKVKKHVLELSESKPELFIDNNFNDILDYFKNYARKTYSQISKPYNAAIIASMNDNNGRADRISRAAKASSEIGAARAANAARIASDARDSRAARAARADIGYKNSNLFNQKNFIAALNKTERNRAATRNASFNASFI